MSSKTDSNSSTSSINSFGSKKSTEHEISSAKNVKTIFEQLWDEFLAQWEERARTGENAGYERGPDCFEQKYGKIEII
jgi:hypothetical protein